MLHILFLILKIAGFLLLAILGLIILLLMSVLLVPVRYRGQGSFYEKPEGVFRITWLLHLFSVRVSYYGEPEIQICILGFRAFKDRGEEAEEFDDGEPVPDEDAFSVRGAHADEEAYHGVLQDEPVLSAQEIKRDEPEDPKLQFSRHEEESEPEKQADIPVKEHLLQRLAGKVKRFFRRLALAFRNICDALKKADNLRESAASFMRDEENQKTYRLIKKQLKKVLRHVLPVKLKGTVTFGFEEPYITGQILTWAALLYPLYHDKLIIRPVFDRQVLEGEVSLKGRIRTGTLLMAGIRVLLNKNFRKQLKRFLNRGGI